MCDGGLAPFFDGLFHGALGHASDGVKGFPGRSDGRLACLTGGPGVLPLGFGLEGAQVGIAETGPDLVILGLQAGQFPGLQRSELFDEVAEVGLVLKPSLEGGEDFVGSSGGRHREVRP